MFMLVNLNTLLWLLITIF